MRSPAVLALVLAAALPAPSRADDDPGDSDDAMDLPFDLVPQTAKARLVGGRTVVIEARFEFDVEGPLPPPGSTRSLALPRDALITGATVQAAGRTHRLQLATVTEADRQFQALFDEPSAATSRMWAIRIDAATDAATVEIAAPKRAHVRLDVTLEVPTCFADDARNMTIPSAWTNVLSGGGTEVSGDRAASLDDHCETSTDETRWLAFPSRGLAHNAGGERRIGTHGSRLPLGDQHLARVEISLASELTTIPQDLHTVLVVDHSRSLTSDDLETQRAVVAAYLRAAPRSRVQLVGYTRTARTLLPGWMLASRATARVDRELRALAPRNGSNLDRGIEAAATLLGNVTGTRRIVVFTDDRLASRLVDRVHLEAVAGGLPADTLVHVVSVNGFEPRLARDDSHELLPLASTTDGVVMRAQLDDHGAIDALPLARPTSLDNLTITAEGWASVFDRRECPGDDHFTEGTSCIWLATGTPASGPVTIEGSLWGKRITRVVEPDRREARALARVLSHFEGLSPELTIAIQRAARAVNAAWSLVATWGAGGYGDLDSWGTIGSGSFGTTSGHTIDGIGHPGVPVRKPTEELLAQLGPGVRACKPRGVVVADVELTKEEIVDVRLTFRDPDDAKLGDCIADGMWDTTLLIPNAPMRVTVRVDFAPR